MNTKQTMPLEVIERRIFIIRGCKVMLDVDLADMYQVPTKRLNEQVRRNKSRFPIDFVFQLTEIEVGGLRSQFATTNIGRGGSRYLPYAFTEHGVAMLSSVLKSPRAVAMNIAIIRAFIKFREMLATQKNIAHKMLELEKIQKEHGSDIADLYSIIKKLIYKPSLHPHPTLSSPESPRNPIGFVRP